MWQNIWQNKAQNLKGLDFNISNLMKIDGFDTSGESLTDCAWVEYFGRVAKVARIDSGKKAILEIGCGGGAALKALSLINNDLEIYGIDYSNSHINIAKNAIKNGTFYCDEAINLDSAFGDKKFDFIFSNSAFHYFPNKDYVFSVVQKSCALLAPNGNLALLDLNDINSKDIYNQIRKGDMSEEEYSQKYAGLNHLFFDRGEIFQLVESLGFRQIIIEDQHIDGYINNECRFNIIAVGKK